MWTALLVMINVQTAQAAWPDDFQPRKNMLTLIRRDLESSISLYRGKERRRRYIRICDAEPKPYYPACEFNSWTITETDRASAEKAGAFFAKRCRTGYKEQLSCVISGLSFGFLEGRPSPDAVDPKGAVGDFRYACEKKKYPAGCAYLGDMYWEGVGVSQDYKKSRELYDEACRAKDTYGCYRKGVLYLHGRGGVSQDYTRAKKLFMKGCADKHAQACIDLGQMYEQGEGVEKSLGKAEEAYNKGCLISSGGACYHLSRVLMKNKKQQPSSLLKAATLFTDLCERKHSMSCYSLGVMKQEGLGLPKDPDTANKLFYDSCSEDIAIACTQASQPLLERKNERFAPQRGLDLLSKGCSLGDPIACVQYAGFLEKGKHIEKDPLQAKKLYEDTCTKNQGVGCQAVGRMYQEGKIVDRDYKKSRTFFERGCWKLADAGSCGALGRNYFQGTHGVLTNTREAFSLLEKACNAEHEYSCGFLGAFYAEGGSIVQKDENKALALYERGCKANNIEACYHAGMLIVDERIANADYQQAWNNLEVACRMDMEKACEASKPIVYQVRFENVIARAAEQKKCEIWTQYPGTEKSTRNVARIVSDTITIFPKKKTDAPLEEYTFSFKEKAYSETETKRVASSVWNVESKSNASMKMEFDHHENWLFQRFPDPIVSFAVDETFSKERNNDYSLFYSRETERIRKERDSRCIFVDKAPELLAENCTEIQALLGAQMLSTCPK